MAKSGTSRRRGSSLVPTLIAAAGFAAVAIALLVFVDAPDSVQEPAAKPAEVAQAEDATTAPLVIPEVEEETLPQETAATAAVIPEETIPATPEVVQPEVADATSPADDVTAHIAAGEFGAALEIARSVEDPAVRNGLIRQVALAQVQSGEYHGALMSVRQSDDEEDFADGFAGGADNLAGGASLADFTELTNLIQTATEGTWQDIDGTGGTMTPYTSGVMAGPMAMLPMLARVDSAGRLESLGLQAREADLNEDVAQVSNMRLVSLRKLEAAVAARLTEGQPVVETMKNLAGLFEVKYIFVDQQDGDIILGGPAAGWAYNEEGQAVADNGRPTLQLDDLVTVMRTFSDSGQQQFRCSIDPREAGLKQLSDYVAKSNARGPIDARRTGSWVRSLQNQLGMQDVTIQGVPASSRVARVIFEADYRMKLIGIGKLAGVKGMASFFDLLSNDQQSNPPSILGLRWWLTMKYDAVLQSPNRDVFEIAGSSVLCQSENEFLSSQGQRVATGGSDNVNTAFAEKFTQHYSELARRDLVFADLQNVFDLALAAALIQQEGLDRQIDWNRGVFASHGDYRTEQLPPTTEINSVVNHKVFNGKDIVVQVAGGVRGDVMPVVNKQRRESARLQGMAVQTENADGRWWWDAK